MIHIKGRYRSQAVELEQPLNIPEGTEVEITVDTPAPASQPGEDAEWSAVGMDRLEAEWDNPGDAIYDDWKRLSGVDSR